uniref:Uncharacterized protein n=1 Tax=Anguilla anguilla TaxID=7936 RepID=A0A0E9Q8H2_ANGAN
MVETAFACKCLINSPADQSNFVPRRKLTLAS